MASIVMVVWRWFGGYRSELEIWMWMWMWMWKWVVFVDGMGMAEALYLLR